MVQQKSVSRHFKVIRFVTTSRICPEILDTKFLREGGNEAAVALELGGENVSEVAVAVLEGDKIFLLLSSSFSSSSFCYRHRHRFLLHNESALPLL